MLKSDLFTETDLWSFQNWVNLKSNDNLSLSKLFEVSKGHKDICSNSSLSRNLEQTHFSIIFLPNFHISFLNDYKFSSTLFYSSTELYNTIIHSYMTNRTWIEIKDAIYL